MKKGTRTKKLQQEYENYKKQAFRPGTCTLCDRERSNPLKKFKHWNIIENLFPWDRIAKKQHMVLPKRHVNLKKLNKAEKAELDNIKLNYLHKNYDMLAEATHRTLSIPDHYHLHLIVLK